MKSHNKNMNTDCDAQENDCSKHINPVAFHAHIPHNHSSVFDTLVVTYPFCLSSDNTISIDVSACDKNKICKIN